MKQLTCEMCGSTDLVKQDGVFVCQTCGCKYSIEEAKKMMIEGTVDVSGSTVKVDNSSQLDNFLKLSENALSVADKESALRYANKALEIQPTNYEAWLAKMESINLLDQSLQAPIACNEAGSHAIEFAPEKEKERISNAVYSYQLGQASFLLRQAINGLEDTDEIHNIFKKFSSISILGAAQNTLQVDTPTITLYNSLAVNATTLTMMISCESLAKGDGLIPLLVQVRNQYSSYLQALTERLKIYGARPTDEAQKTRDKIYDSLDKRIESAEEAKVSLYWEAHPEEKARLTEEKDTIDSEIFKTQKEINALETRDDITELQDQLNVLQARKGSLGIFKGKEKKNVQCEIDEVSKTLDARREEIAPQIDSLQKKLSNLSTRYNEIKNRLKSPQ